MPQILAADIGGTSSRFGHFESGPGQEPRLLYSCTIPTAAVSSFAELLSALREKAFSLLPEKADHFVLAVAGPVHDGLRCRLTNAAWGIDLSRPAAGVRPATTSLINDFAAQALGCTTRAAAATAVTVQQGVAQGGVIATIGAGTGLGHCLLVPVPGSDRFAIVPSEGGHAPFGSAGDEELFAFIRCRTKLLAVHTELVVSGRGLSLVHEFVTGRSLEPVDVAREIGPDSPTTAVFARCYGRACQSYALYVLPRGGMHLCGGLAVKNPFLVTHPAFRESFTDNPTYADLLREIPVRLVVSEDTGLLGAAAWGALRLEL